MQHNPDEILSVVAPCHNEAASFEEGKKIGWRDRFRAIWVVGTKGGAYGLVLGRSRRVHA